VANEQIQLVSSAVIQLNIDLVNSENMVEDLSAQTKLTESLASNMSEAEDSAIAQVHILSTRMMEIKAQLEQANNEKEGFHKVKCNLEHVVEDYVYKDHRHSSSARTFNFSD